MNFEDLFNFDLETEKEFAYLAAEKKVMEVEWQQWEKENQLRKPAKIEIITPFKKITDELKYKCLPL